jgi:transposase
LTSKIHAVVDTNGLPVRLGLTAGEAHDNRLALRLLSRPRLGSMLLADRGYDADWIRAFATERGAWANVPPRCNRREPLGDSIPGCCWDHQLAVCLERFSGWVGLGGVEITHHGAALSHGGPSWRRSRGHLGRMLTHCILSERLAMSDDCQSHGAAAQ